MRTFADFNWQAAPATSSFFIKPDELSRGALLQYLGLRQKSLGIGVRGIEPKRFLKLRYGFRVAARFRKRHAEIQVARSKLRSQPDNFLKLSEGNEEKLREFVAVAKRDYRDVLFWAENPEEAKLDTPEKRERIKKMFEKFGIKPPESEPDWH